MGNINLEQLKADFKKYQERMAREESRITGEPVEIKDGSIFLNSDEFKNYLVEEYGADSSVYSKDINEIIEELTHELSQTPQEVDEQSAKKQEQEKTPEEKELDEQARHITITDSNGEERTINLSSYEKVMSNSFDDDFVMQAIQDAFDEDIEQEAFNNTESNKIQEFYENSLNSQNEDEIEANEADNSNEINSDENEDTQNQTMSDYSLNDELLDNVYQDEKVISTLDSDNDGVLSSDDKTEFQDYIKGYDGDEAELSRADILRSYEDIQNDEFSYDDDVSEKARKHDNKIERKSRNADNLHERRAKAQERDKNSDKKNDVKEESKTPKTNKSNSSSAGGSVSSGGGGVSGMGANISSNTLVQNQEEQGETLEQLEAQKKEKETEVQKATDDVQKVQSGENENVKKAQEESDKLQKNYEEALKNDKNVSKELKDKETQTLTQIKEQEDIINKSQSDITGVDSEIKALEADVSSKESTKTALENSLSELQSNTSDNPEQQQKIQEKISEVEAKIKEADEALKSAQKSLDDKNKEKEIQKTCSDETKKLLEDFNKSKEDVEKIKAKELEDAKKVQENAQKELDEINKKIDEKKTQEVENENSVGGEFSQAFNSNPDFAKGVFADKGEYIEEVCSKYGVDPYLASAIMASETGWGTSNAVKEKNNPGGFMDPNTGCSTIKTFGSLDEGIEAVVRNLSKGYISQGLTTISSIGAKYCPVGASNDPTGLNNNWVPTVTKIYNTLSGKNIDSNTQIQ